MSTAQVAIYERKSNFQVNVHAVGCGCRITDKYDFIKNTDTVPDDRYDGKGIIYHLCTEGK